MEIGGYFLKARPGNKLKLPTPIPGFTFPFWKIDFLGGPDNHADNWFVPFSNSNSSKALMGDKGQQFRIYNGTLRYGWFKGKDRRGVQSAGISIHQEDSDFILSTYQDGQLHRTKKVDKPDLWSIKNFGSNKEDDDFILNSFNYAMYRSKEAWDKGIPEITASYSADYVLAADGKSFVLRKEAERDPAIAAREFEITLYDLNNQHHLRFEEDQVEFVSKPAIYGENKSALKNVVLEAGTNVDLDVSVGFTPDRFEIRSSALPEQKSVSGKIERGNVKLGDTTNAFLLPIHNTARFKVPDLDIERKNLPQFGVAILTLSDADGNAASIAVDWMPPVGMTYTNLTGRIDNETKESFNYVVPFNPVKDSQIVYREVDFDIRSNFKYEVLNKSSDFSSTVYCITPGKPIQMGVVNSKTPVAGQIPDLPVEPSLPPTIPGEPSNPLPSTHSHHLKMIGSADFEITTITDTGKTVSTENDLIVSGAKEINISIRNIDSATEIGLLLSKIKGS